MNHDLFPQHLLNNTQLDDRFIAQKAAELATQPPAYTATLADWLSTHCRENQALF